MLYHYLKLAWRNLSRSRIFTLINIFGLTIGLTSCVVIGLYVDNEMSFDRFHANHSRIYRINKNLNEKGKQSQKDGITPGLLAPALEQEASGIAWAGRFRPWFNDMLVSHDTIRIKLKDVCYADESFLKIFDFPLIAGNSKTALSLPNTAIITESTAKKYFGHSNPIGMKMITLNDIPVTVSGIVKDPPANSSIQFTMLISWSTVTAPANTNYFFWMNSWTINVDYTFVLLKENVSPEKMNQTISRILHAHLSETEFTYQTWLQPLNDIHLNSSNIFFSENFRSNNGRIIYALLIIAAFILLIACFNFINLTTADALGRAKETGVEKVLGAGRWQLLGKFFTETTLLLSISLGLALILTSMVIPYFNQLANSSLSMSSLAEPRILSALFIMLITLSFAAGLYPAFFLARFRSTDVFRNIIKAGKDVWIRKTLVTMQFALSLLLIIATLVVQHQTKFLNTKDLGFDKDQILVMQIANTHLEGRTNAFIAALKNDPSISDITVTNRVPGQSFNGYGVIPEGYTLNDHIMANVLETDVEFAKTYNIQITKGRYFSAAMPSDTNNAVIINEAMAKEVHWKEPVGKKFEVYQETKGTVIGVVKDFNFATLRENIKPLAIMLRNNPLYLSIKMRQKNIQTSIDRIQTQWKLFDKENPFEYFFIDEQMNHFYESDIRLLRVLTLFSSLAICIACVGLFGLSMYSTRQRTKEIGIRKVLGAPVSDIVGLLSRDFIKLVMVATLVAFPLAWWVMNNWLQDFAYRIRISWTIFFFAGLAVMLIALMTVSFQAIRAALANPVKSLRTE
ncbi:MAG: ABC transporter permease [Chitinophagales bacterium]